MNRRHLPILALAVLVSACQTPGGEMRRASIRSQWLLTKLSTLKARSGLRTDLAEDLNRQRGDLERLVRTNQSSFRRAYKDEAYEDMRRAIERLDQLEAAYAELAEKYSEATSNI